MLNLPVIKEQSVRHILKNSKIFPKKKERNHVGKVFGESLELFSICIYEDFSSEINFNATVIEKTDSTLIALVGKDGELLDAFFEKEF